MEDAERLREGVEKGMENPDCIGADRLVSLLIRNAI